MSLNPEQIDHINLVNWFHHNFPDLAEDFHHFANERKCSVMEGRTLKRMGVKRGVADFFLALPVQNRTGFWWAGLWLELKVGKGKLTPEQSVFLHRKLERGYEAIAVWGFEAAKKAILKYLDKENDMESLRVTILRGDSYDSFFIPDIETFLLKLRADPKVSDKYKKMNAGEFKQWVEDEITPKQFEKLQKINKL